MKTSVNTNHHVGDPWPGGAGGVAAQRVHARDLSLGLRCVVVGEAPGCEPLIGGQVDNIDITTLQQIRMC